MLLTGRTRCESSQISSYNIHVEPTLLGTRMSLLPLDGSKFRSEKHTCPLGSTYEQLRRLASAGDDFLAVNRSEVFICDSEWRLAPKTQPSCKRGWSDPPVASSEAPDKSSPHLLAISPHCNERRAQQEAGRRKLAATKLSGACRRHPQNVRIF